MMVRGDQQKPSRIIWLEIPSSCHPHPTCQPLPHNPGLQVRDACIALLGFQGVHTVPLSILYVYPSETVGKKMLQQLLHTHTTYFECRCKMYLWNYKPNFKINVSASTVERSHGFYTYTCLPSAFFIVGLLRWK